MTATDHSDHSATESDGSHSGHEGKAAGGRKGHRDHTDHKDMNHRDRHLGSRHGQGAPGGSPPETTKREPDNNALNLTIALAIPALLGAAGGRALKARAISTAT